MRTLIIAALLLATIPVSDWLVAKFPPPAVEEPMGYTDADRKAMDRLLDSIRGPKKPAPDLLRRQAEAYARAYGIDLRHLDNALNIFGE